ncbi:LacI family DNA-binding transcriptional regulator [Asanoa siamensis]|uniref:Ribose operon repressor RbsR n=1 Tax=Asanoa siamensis TaxID=926357 RepID=A0ABQ4CT10_9ACTN|nr:LacI family DNA-binding transcriptional regulator [Asanoa siamensis]GIF74431.1 ribose operon repressor RbsR [Asanoa siamensis]
MTAAPLGAAADTSPASRTGIRQVADRAGVAPSSVSRVLSGHPDVSAVMRNRVLDAVSALGYEPDMLAQSLRRGATMSIGFIVSDISNPLFAEIALAAETRLQDRGFSLLITNAFRDPSTEADRIRMLSRRRVDGMLISVSDEGHPGITEALSSLKLRVVLIDRELPAVRSAVLSDHARGIGEAVAHLISLGHQRIALINGSAAVRPSRERQQALRRACRGSGVNATVRHGTFSPEHGYKSTMELLSGKEPPTAIIAGSNQILVGVLHAARELGVHVPHDVSLVTCDDLTLAGFLTPALATISRDTAAIGRAAAGLLLDLIDGQPPRIEVLPTGFRPAGSCAPPARLTS